MVINKYLMQLEVFHFWYLSLYSDLRQPWCFTPTEPFDDKNSPQKYRYLQKLYDIDSKKNQFQIKAYLN